MYYVSILCYVNYYDNYIIIIIYLYMKVLCYFFLDVF